MPRPRRDAPVTTYMPTELVERIDELAAREGLTRASWARRALLRAVRPEQHDTSSDDATAVA